MWSGGRRDLLLVVLPIVLLISGKFFFGVDEAPRGAPKSSPKESPQETAVSLTKKTYKQLTENKIVFLKFFAPWCGHCQELAPDWERVALEWQNHGQGLVGQVDCTVEDDWCHEMGVSGLPTIMYGDPSFGGSFLQTYDDDDRSYETLSEFANKTLIHAICSPGNLQACDSSTRIKFEEYWKMSESEIDAAIQEKEELIARADEAFEREMKRMQSEYDVQSTENELKVAKIKNTMQILVDVQMTLMSVAK